MQCLPELPVSMKSLLILSLLILFDRCYVLTYIGIFITILQAEHTLPVVSQAGGRKKFGTVLRGKV